MRCHVCNAPATRVFRSTRYWQDDGLSIPFPTCETHSLSDEMEWYDELSDEETKVFMIMES